jgi:hypothetical protein
MGDSAKQIARGSRNIFRLGNAAFDQGPAGAFPNLSDNQSTVFPHDSAKMLNGGRRG